MQFACYKVSCVIFSFQKPVPGFQFECFFIYLYGQFFIVLFTCLLEKSKEVLLMLRRIKF
uniref:Uncharacterized protein n=1 Tax=Anguilla anguilla TaxID=7936 RepID=A0A0E9RS66_ANGAN